VEAGPERRTGRATDGHEGIADGDHALPAPASESGAVGVLPHAHRCVHVSLRELLVDDGEIGAPEPIVPFAPDRQEALQTLELLVHRGAGAAQHAVFWQSAVNRPPWARTMHRHRSALATNSRRGEVTAFPKRACARPASCWAWS